MTRAAAGLLLGVALAACSMAPEYTRPDVDPPRDWRVPAEGPGSLADLPWWELFHDRELQDLIRTGLTESKDGLILTAAGLVSLLMMFLGSIMAQHARPALTVGLLWLSLAGMTAFTTWLSFVDITAPWHRALAGTILAGAFAGLALGPTIAFMVRDQSPAEELRVRASKFFLHFLGGSLGILLAGVILATGIDTAHESLRIGMIPGLDPTHQLRRTIEAHAIQRGSSAPEATAQATMVLDAWIQRNARVMGYQTTLRWVAVFSLAALAVALAIPLTLRQQ